MHYHVELQSSIQAFDLILALGYSPLACIGKAPRRKGWTDGNTAAERAALQPGDNIGILCGGASNLVAFDFDISNPSMVAALLAGPCFAGCPVRVGRWPRALALTRATEPVPSQDWGHSGLPQGEKIQIISTGRQFVAWGVHPDTQRPYKWTVPLKPLAELPVRPVVSP